MTLGLIGRVLVVAGLSLLFVAYLDFGRTAFAGSVTASSVVLKRCASNR